MGLKADLLALRMAQKKVPVAAHTRVVKGKVEKVKAHFRQVHYENAALYGVENWKSWRQSLTYDERLSVKDYVDFGYTEMNEFLRKGGRDRLPWMTSGAQKELERNIKNLDSALAKSKVPENLTVYRNVSIQDADEPLVLRKQFASMHSGQEFTDKAFVSTSLQRLHWSDSDINIEIHVPKGYQGGYVAGAFHTGVEAQEKAAFRDDEQEILLRRGTKFRVVSPLTDALTGYPTMVLEVVP